MAYRIKSLKYFETPRKILLQNENGPCPLLAAANALLLRGVITLPSPCIRNGVVSIDELINVLAERAIKRSNDEAAAAASAGEWTPVDKKKKGNLKSGDDDCDQKQPSIRQQSSHEYHLDELLSILPNLQYGMDVNPKFTSGPTGIEYTLGLTAFDLLGVELVHGWLLDPNDTHDKHTAAVIGGKTYNELIELVISGNEAGAKVDVMSDEILKKEQILEEHRATRTGATVEEEKTTIGHNVDDNVKVGQCRDKNMTMSAQNDAKELAQEKEEWVNVETKSAITDTKPNDGDDDCVTRDVDKKLSAADKSQQKTDDEKSSSPSNEEKIEGVNATKSDPTPNDSATSSSTASGPLSDEEMSTLTEELSKLKTQYNETTDTATNGTVINTFLSSTSHQLTYHGLHELHKFVAEQSLCVFFRNNHFATLTKHNGILYLLVTDLGYANVPEVIWEKLDAIDGDTEYADEYFSKPKPRETLGPASGPSLSPEDVLAQRGRSEADYQLALQLSKDGGKGAKSQSQLDEEEGRLMAAATEASLREYNKNSGHSSNVASGSSTTTQPLGSNGNDNGGIEDSDHKMAMALQAQLLETDHESEELARRLQNEENNRVHQQRQQTGGGRPKMSPIRNQQQAKNSSDAKGQSCVIS